MITAILFIVMLCFYATGHRICGTVALLGVLLAVLAML